MLTIQHDNFIYPKTDNISPPEIFFYDFYEEGPFIVKFEKVSFLMENRQIWQLGMKKIQNEKKNDFFLLLQRGGAFIVRFRVVGHTFFLGIPPPPRQPSDLVPQNFTFENKLTC